MEADAHREEGAAVEEAAFDTLLFKDGSRYTGTLRTLPGEQLQPDGVGTCTWADGERAPERPTCTRTLCTHC